MKWRVSAGKNHVPAALAKKVAVKATDSAAENHSMTSGVWKASGRNGNTPPQTLAALMARKSP